jgi:putative PIN family toxin of toxin-antitoxin system
MNIIVDTNLWISFLIGKKLSVLKALFSNPKLKIYVCDNLIDEIEDVSSRPKIRKYISETDVIETFKLIEMYCTHIPINKIATSPVRDAKDLYLLSLADAIPADYILTGDKDLLSLRVHNQTIIVKYSDFLSMLK